jgi:hypothetical protein
MADVEASGLWPGKVVTEISEAVPCWVAEAEHQDTSSAIQTAHPALPAAGLEAATSRDPAQRRAFERTAIRAADASRFVALHWSARAALHPRPSRTFR